MSGFTSTPAENCSASGYQNTGAGAALSKIPANIPPIEQFMQAFSISMENCHPPTPEKVQVTADCC